jgi:hypothetical protein
LAVVAEELVERNPALERVLQRLGEIIVTLTEQIEDLFPR